MSAAFEVLLAGLTFPEAPRWRDGRLWFSDFYSHRVLAADLAGRLDVVAEVAQQPSGLGWRPDGSLLIVSMLDRRLLRQMDGQIETIADLSRLATGPANDMVVDASGRAYVGNMGYNRRLGESPRAAKLSCVHPDGRVCCAAEDLIFPNGMAITPDGARLIVAESFASRLTVFEIQADGVLANRRVFADLGGASPDGICLDAEGAVWVADPQGNALLRVFEGGRIAEKFSTGPRSPFACMLGGEDRRTLFVCTNDRTKLGAVPTNEGRIETIGASVPGAGLP